MDSTILPKYQDAKITVNLKHSITGHITTRTPIISVFQRIPIFTSDIRVECSNDMLLYETQTTTLRLYSPSLEHQTKTLKEKKL